MTSPLQRQVIAKTGGVSLRGQFFEPRRITEHMFSRISLQYFRAVKCVVSGKQNKKKENNVTELYHSTFILGQVGIITKVVQNLTKNQVI